MDEHANLLRLLCGQMHLMLMLTLSRDRYNKNFLDLDNYEMADVQAGLDAALRLVLAKLDPQTVAAMMKLPPIVPPNVH